ncbi:MAG TPA: protein kinase [Polyangiaceae bacterium]|nr:protein kinase [Polyangiaceae bacterium]
MLPPMPPGSTGPFKVGDRILDKWEVRGLLGKGGHAFVYDCFNAFLNTEVALKVIPPVPHRGTKLFERARDEARFLYEANHPNVVRVSDAGELDGMVYIVMEKLEGANLREMMRELGPLTLIEALTIALPVAEALEAAHAMNVIHRDLKPENIFLLPGNVVKVLDFGIAKFLHGEHPTTQRDLIQGTAPYMSPEQAQGVSVRFASDIFQLGTILYEMIAGICPCMIGLEEPTQNVILAIQIGKMPPRLKSVVRGVPDHVDRLVWGAIAKDPAQRYASMSIFAQEIRNCIALLFAQLGEHELTIRTPKLKPKVPQKKAPSQPPARPSLPVPPNLQTTPIALAASTSLPAAPRLGPAGTEEIPVGRPTSASPDAHQNPDPALPPDTGGGPLVPRAPEQAPEPERAATSASRETAPANARHPRTRSGPARQGREGAQAVLVAAVQHPATLARGAHFVGTQPEASDSVATRRKDRNAARRMLARAALIGVGLACPLGIAGGLWIRSHAAASAGVASSLAPAAYSAPAAQQVQRAPLPAPSATVEVVALTPAPAAPIASAAASAPAPVKLAPVEAQRSLASARPVAPPPAAPAVHSSAPIAPRPAKTASAIAVPAASPPVASAASKSKSPKAPASAPAADHIRPLIF